MNSFFKLSIIAVLATAALSACSNDKDTDIPVTDVPPNIINIVQNTLPGISLTEAEKEVKNNIVNYKLEGKLINGKEYEIEITESGTIIKIELED